LNLTGDKEFTAEVFQAESGVFEVILVSEGVSVAEQLRAAGFGTADAGDQRSDSTSNVETEEFFSADEDEEGETGTETKPTTSDPSSVADADEEVVRNVGDLQQERLVEGERVNVSVSHVDTISSFWVHLESRQSELDALLDSMFEFYSELEEGNLSVADDVRVDCVFAALYTDDSWYRVKATKAPGVDDEIEVSNTVEAFWTCDIKTYFI
jgi:hypothetical protein